MVAVASVVPVSLLVSMVRRVSTRTVDCCLEDVRQTYEFPWPSPCRTGRRSARVTDLIMEVIHSRCAGMHVSKRNAKVCVRGAGRGRRRTVETVWTSASTTNAILELREHLIAEQMSSVVLEATCDYWKPFYYLLGYAWFELMLVNARQVKNLPGRERETSPTPPGWPSSARTAWSAARSCRPHRSLSCGT
jgi:hypothetical protein